MKNKDSKKNPGPEKQQYKKYLPYVLFIIIGFALYAQTLQFGYSSLDDEPIIVQNSTYLSKISNSLDVFRRDAFLSPKGEFYRPLQSLSFIINSQISGTEAWSYHLGNLLLFIIVISLLYYYLQQNGVSKTIALFGSLVLLIHPLAAHFVCWIPARGDLLLAIFILFSAIVFNKYLLDNRITFAVAHAIFFLLALFAKETAVMFIPIGIFFIYQIRKSDRGRTILLFTCIWAVDLIIYFLLRYSVFLELPSQNFGVGVFVKNLPSVFEMFGKIFIPYPVSPLPHIHTVPVIIGLVLFIVLFSAAFYKFRANRSTVVLALLWFLCFILPPLAFRSSYADFGYEYLEHRVILPAMGLFFLFIPVQKSFEAWLKKYKYYVLIPTAGLGFFTFTHAGIYSNPKSFFQAAINADPQNAFANYQLGCLTFGEENYEEAITYYKRAVDIAPSESDFWNALAALYFNLNNQDKALNCFLESLKHNPDNWQTLRNLGTLYNSRNDFATANMYYTKSLALTPNKVLILGDRANTKYLSGDYAGALNDCNTALKIQPDALDVLITQAKALLKSDQIDKALTVLINAERLSPEDLEILFYKGVAQVNLHHEIEGLLNIRTAADRGFQPAVEYLHTNPK